jgi:hypothetical protein
MILTIITFVVLIAGVYMCIKGDKTYNEALINCGFAATVVGSIVAVIMVLLIIVSHIGVDVTIEKNRIKYESLCERYELIASDYEDVSKSDIIKEITEWNLSVYSEKHWANNPWTNWFHSKRVADSVEMIEIK